MDKKKGLIVSPDNPFRDAIAKIQAGYVPSQQSFENEYDSVKIIAIEFKRKRTNPFAQLEQRAFLLELSMAASKVFLYIAAKIGYNAEQIELDYDTIGINYRTFNKAALELIMHNVIRKADKPKMYWVNITLLIVGRIDKL